ncbi:MAG: outer membrane protein assembly factor BamD [Bacteroidales bacterium]|nr:outer membrane protein assembly factor BamD [Bacteroidales bacterium]
MRIISKLGLIVLTIAILSGCTRYEKLLKSADSDAKYEAAMKYYEAHNYTKAIQLFENLIMHYHGKEHSEDIAWYYAMSLMQEQDYFSAGYQFRTFYKHYPYNDRAEEALYNAAMCKYHESPEYYLDQKQTTEAITDFESYLDRYPTSVHVPEINGYLDEMRAKLMKKEYEIAYGYYKIESYHAAYVSFGNFINNYPESASKEDAMYYMIKSGYELAINSQESKVEERTKQVVADFERFGALVSNPKYKSDLQEIYNKSRNLLAKISK